MNVRGVLGVTALVAAFLLGGLVISLAGAALWKGSLPGEENDVVAAATPVRPAPVATVRPGANAATSPAATPGRAAASPTPAAAAATGATVLELIICDASVDCGENPNRREWDAVSACVRTRGAENRALVLAITTEDVSPTGAARAPIVARSDPFRGEESLTCQTVRVLRGTLRAGDYTMWLLDGSTVLRQQRFHLGR